MSITGKQVKMFCGLAVTCCVISSGTMYLRKKLEDRIFDLKVCQSSIKALEQHQKSVEVLGEPLTIKRPSLKNIFNKITNTNATIAIPVIGEKTGGNLLIVAHKSESDIDWTIDSLKLEVPKENVAIKE